MVVHTKTLHNASMLVLQVRQHSASRRVRGYTHCTCSDIMRLWIFLNSYTIFYCVATYLSSAVASVTPTVVSSHRHGMVHHGMVHHGMVHHRVVSHAWHMSVTAVVRHGCWTGRCLTHDLTCVVAETRTPRSLLQTGFIFRPTYLIGQIARRRCSDSQPIL